ncbi:NAF1-domain-containing protein [Periconia macrospinosa]|uniref:H/ACA ribonucleoprotein complex non-core subunit NAF1 n=1 Tax=Periconia macrospinosa TaxID=97972 RepID=A0A2V1DTH2_9PLEO|nr:NAF1-domain-containing protein [Periconia macrospinosa]
MLQTKRSSPEAHLKQFAPMAEPPAKKARLDGDSPSGEPVVQADAPASPVDDSDDDFYETPQLDNAGGAKLETVMPSTSTAAAQPNNAASALIPGLGFWTAPPPTDTKPAPQPSSLDAEAGDELEDGEVSDTDVFYGGDKSDAQASVTATEDALQHNANDAPDTIAPAVPAIVPPTSSDTQPNPDANSSTIPVATESDAVDEGKIEFLQAAEANKDNTQAEWQLDSEASDSSDSSSDDSSSDSDSDSDGELLTTEEAIKRMLAEDPEDGDAPAPKAKVKTQNEVDEQYQKPDITVTETMQITELGQVENIVDNLILIKANVSGDYHVLESGSVVCLANREVVGQISETIGRVQDPRYSVGFATAEEIAASEITKGTRIYYVNDHSTFVYTEPLRAEKHTDASGQYDEETNAKEFSDDEEEAQFKREAREKKKDLKRKANGDDHDDAQPASYPNLPYGNETTNDSRGSAAPSSYQSAPLKYSDDEDEDLGMYRPLARPDRFEDVVGAGAPLEDRSHVRRGAMRGRGGWGDRGRGFRGRGAMGGGRGDRFDRGGMHNGGGRGDRFDRGGANHNGGRGDRGGQNNRGRGDRSNRGQNDRQGRHQQQERQMSGPPQDNRQGGRGAYSPSPARQNQGRHQPSQQSPPRGKKNRKRHHRGTPDRSSQPPAPAAGTSMANANMNAYSTNNAQSGADWNASYSTTTPASYTTPGTNAPAPTAAYGNPAYYPQQAQTAAQAQANMAQWIQLAAALQQAQAQQQAVPPPPQPAQQPAQAQYPYPYQYQQASAPNAGQASNQPAGTTPSLQDILRALGNGTGN